MRERCRKKYCGVFTEEYICPVMAGEDNISFGNGPELHHHEREKPSRRCINMSANTKNPLSLLDDFFFKV